MTQSRIRNWSTTAASNNLAAPYGAPESIFKFSETNDWMRQTMADVRAWYEDAQYVDMGHTISYVSVSSFKITGSDQRTVYTDGRRIKAFVGVGQVTGDVLSTTFAAGDTSITVTLDSGALDNSLSSVAVGILTPSGSGVPKGLDLYSGRALSLSALAAQTVSTSGLTAAAAQFGSASASALNIGSGSASALNALVMKERGRGLGRLDVVVISGATDAPDGNDIATIRVYTNAGGCAVALPSVATVGDGWRFQGINASGGNVTYTRAGGGDAIDGGGTAITQQTDSGYRRLDFYVAGGTWFTSTRRFKSANQTITAAGALTLAHGLAAQPDRCEAILTCLTAELGYNIGDELIMNAFSQNDGTTNRGLSVVPDATNLNVRYGSSNPTFSILNKATGVNAAPTAANWRLILTAEY